MYLELTLISFPAMSCLEKDSKSACTQPGASTFSLAITSWQKRYPTASFGDSRQSTANSRSKRSDANPRSPNRQNPFYTKFGIVVSPIWGPGTSKRSRNSSKEWPSIQIHFPRRDTIASLHLWLPDPQSQRCTDAMTNGSWRPYPQRHLWLDHPNRLWGISIFPHVYRRRNSHDLPLCIEVKISQGGTGMFPQIPQHLRTGWTTCHINSNRWRPGISQTDGRVMRGDRHPPRRNSPVYPGAKLWCRMSQQDYLRTHSSNPCRDQTPEGTLGRNRLCCCTSQEPQPHFCSQWKDPL